MKRVIFSFLAFILISTLLINVSSAQSPRTLSVAFIWNQHQPMYKDLRTGSILLPWVRLHSVKNYYPMAAYLEQYPQVKANFNLTPVLLAQLQDYNQGTQDIYELLSRKSADSLTDQEKAFIRNNFFQTQVIHQKSVPAHFRHYQQLYRKSKSSTPFTAQNYRDTQVLFNLAWFDPQTMEQELTGIWRKGSNFTEQEKIKLLKKQQEIMQKVIPLHKKLQNQEQIEIITTPYYHPILPLLMDINYAKRSNLTITLPSIPFAYPEDAQIHVKKALIQYWDLFGRLCYGLWPSEQAVCPEMIPLLTANKLRWLVTDEKILENSLGIKIRSENKTVTRPEILYKPYIVNFQGSEMVVVFRDQEISDMIGFGYSKMDPQEAAKDLVSRLEKIASSLPEKQGNYLVTIALDGENPWENYPDDKRSFLNSLYGILSKHPFIKTVTVNKYLENNPPADRLPVFASGSWNGGNVDRWIGTPAKNRAWELLAVARNDFLTAVQKNIPKQKQMLAWESLMAAEGSDYTWWFDSMPYEQAIFFDELYRLHLQNIYLTLELPVPDNLKFPIIAKPRPQAPDLRFLRPVFIAVDPPYDDKGAGRVYYPSSKDFAPGYGLFDLLKFEIFLTSRDMIFRLTFDQMTNPWNSPLGFSHQLINIYVSTGELKPKTVPYRDGVNVVFNTNDPWSYFIKATGWPTANTFIRASDGKNFKDRMRVYSDLKEKTVIIAVDRKIMSDPRNKTWGFYVFVGSFDGLNGRDGFRIVEEQGTAWTFGNGETNCSLIIDYLCPSNLKQEEVLDNYERKKDGQQVRLFPVIVKFD